jgi:hypothetical protein
MRESEGDRERDRQTDGTEKIEIFLRNKST